VGHPEYNKDYISNGVKVDYSQLKVISESFGRMCRCSKWFYLVYLFAKGREILNNAEGTIKS